MEPSSSTRDTEPSTIGIEGGNKRRKVKSFNYSWLEDEIFAEWLTSDPDSGKAYCRACNKILTGGKSELSKHATRVRHFENINILRKNNPSALLPLSLTKQIWTIKIK